MAYAAIASMLVKAKLNAAASKTVAYDAATRGVQFTRRYMWVPSTAQ